MILLSTLILLAPAAVPELTPEERAWRVLSEGATSKTPQGRKEAALALALAPRQEPYCGLARKLADDRDPEVRSTALSSLALIGHPDAVLVLKKALSDKIPEVVLAAARGLYQMKQPEGREVLEDMVSGETKSSSNPLVSEARDVLRQLSAPKSAAWFLLFNGVGYAPVPGLGEALYAMHLMNDTGTLPPRASVVLLMARDKDPSVVEAIRHALKDKEWQVRAAAAQAYVAHGDGALRDELIPLLDDKHEQVRLRASAAYLHLLHLSESPPSKPDQKNRQPLGDVNSK